VSALLKIGAIETMTALGRWLPSASRVV